MSGLYALVVGSIVRDVETRVDKNGKDYLLFSVKIIEGTVASFVGVLAFNEAARAELAGLGQGDVVSIVGRLQANLWTDKAGEATVGLRLVADKVSPFKASPPREKKAATSTREIVDQRAREKAERQAAPFDDGLDDLPLGGPPR